MRSSCQKLKLKMMHDVLDKQLQQINNQSSFTTYQNLKRSQDRMKQSRQSRRSIGGSKSKLNQNNNQTFKQLTNSSASKKNQINDLEKKLIQLEKKMECIDFSSSQSQSENIRDNIQNNNQKSIHKLLIPNNKQNNSSKKITFADFQRKKLKQQYQFKNQDKQNAEDSSQEEDSQDNFVPTIATKDPFQKVFTNKLKQIIKDKKPNDLAAQNKSFKKTQGDDQLNFLEQKYSHLKNKQHHSNTNKNMRSSEQSQKSLNAKRNQKQKPHNKNTSSRNFSHDKSLKNNKSIKSFNSSRSRSKSQRKDQSRISGMSINSLKNQDLQINKQTKRIANLEKQLVHYKRLTKKLQQKIKDMEKIQIQYRKLKTNFTKSQQVRKQQKKLIENLKARKTDV